MVNWGNRGTNGFVPLKPSIQCFDCKAQPIPRRGLAHGRESNTTRVELAKMSAFCDYRTGFFRTWQLNFGCLDILQGYLGRSGVAKVRGGQPSSSQKPLG